MRLGIEPVWASQRLGMALVAPVALTVALPSTKFPVVNTCFIFTFTLPVTTWLRRISIPSYIRCVLNCWSENHKMDSVNLTV